MGSICSCASSCCQVLRVGVSKGCSGVSCAQPVSKAVSIHSGSIFLFTYRPRCILYFTFVVLQPCELLISNIC